MSERYCFCSAGMPLPIVGHGQDADSQASFGQIGLDDCEVEGQGAKGGGGIICPGKCDVLMIDVEDTLGNSVSSCR